MLSELIMESSLLIIGGIAYLLLSKGKTKEVIKPKFWRGTALQMGSKYKPIFDAAEKKYKIPDNILARVGWRESRFEPEIVLGHVNGKADERGIMQITPRWHPNVAYTDPQKAIPYAAKYLSDMYKRFGTWKMAVAAYNWGPTNVAKYLKGEKSINDIPNTTKNYIFEVFGTKL